MKVVVLGKSGQVATALQRSSDPTIDIIALGRDELDLAGPADVRSAISLHSPDAIINAAAYTAVDQAETDVESAKALNVHAVRRLGQAADELNIPMIHISTDYVFDGSGERPWRPEDPTGPLGVYGQTKLAGERALAEVCTSYAILRTSWVYSPYGANFVKTMLRLGRDRAELNIVGDQIGGPTSAQDIANATINMAKALMETPQKSGIWHYSGQDDCSWADFATEIFDQSNIDCVVHPIPSSEYPTPAKRPLNSRLNCTATLRDFGIDRPSWKQSLANVLKELGETQ